MGHSNSNSNPNHLNHHGPKPNTHIAHRPTCARPSPPLSFLSSPADAARTAHYGPTHQPLHRASSSSTGAADKRGPLVSFPFFLPQRSARPHSAPPARSPRSMIGGPNRRAPLFLFSLPPRPPLARITGCAAPRLSRTPRTPCRSRSPNLSTEYKSPSRSRNPSCPYFSPTAGAAPVEKEEE
jgi:hypothetical protein